jgi:hypothetical protein
LRFVTFVGEFLREMLSSETILFCRRRVRRFRGLLARGRGDTFPGVGDCSIGPMHPTLLPPHVEQFLADWGHRAHSRDTQRHVDSLFVQEHKPTRASTIHFRL